MSEESPAREPGPEEVSPEEEEARVEAGRVVAIERSVQATFVGPIPAPSVLRQYDELVPGAAERILAQAERQTDHRINLERTVIESDVERSKAGVRAGFAVSMTTIVGGVCVALFASPTAGATIATASVVSLAAVFLYGTMIRRRELSEKAKELPPS